MIAMGKIVDLLFLSFFFFLKMEDAEREKCRLLEKAKGKKDSKVFADVCARRVDCGKKRLRRGGKVQNAKDKFERCWVRWKYEGLQTN